MRELIKVNNQTIKSTELVEVINQFRKVEKGKSELKHKTFIEKIKKEVESLKLLGLGSEQNFLPTYYIDLQGKERPCFELNRDGMLQMLNSESTLVRYKTIEYINELEARNTPEQIYLNMDEEDRAIAYFKKAKENRLLNEKKMELESKIKEDKPLVDLALERIDMNGCISITDVTKSFNLKRGQVTKWAKENKYIHKKLPEVNNVGEKYFKVYMSGAYKCVGVKEEGLRLINDNLEIIKNI